MKYIIFIIHLGVSFCYANQTLYYGANKTCTLLFSNNISSIESKDKDNFTVDVQHKQIVNVQFFHDANLNIYINQEKYSFQFIFKASQDSCFFDARSMQNKPKLQYTPKSKAIKRFFKKQNIGIFLESILFFKHNEMVLNFEIKNKNLHPLQIKDIQHHTFKRSGFLALSPSIIDQSQSSFVCDDTTVPAKSKTQCQLRIQEHNTHAYGWAISIISDNDFKIYFKKPF